MIGGPGDSDAGVAHTTGILVLGSVQPVTGTIITANTISNVFYGVYLSGPTVKANVSNNTTTFDAGGTAMKFGPTTFQCTCFNVSARSFSAFRRSWRRLRGSDRTNLVTPPTAPARAV